MANWSIKAENSEGECVSKEIPENAEDSIAASVGSGIEAYIGDGFTQITAHETGAEEPPARKDPPPFLLINQALQAGKMIPFIGSAVSAASRREGETWDVDPQQVDPEFPPFPPTGAELSRYLAKLCGYPSRNLRELSNLASVASFFEVQAAFDSQLRDTIENIFQNVSRTNPVHDYIASIDCPLLIVTTNYDQLIERAFDALSKPYHVIVHDAELFLRETKLRFQKDGREDEGSKVSPKELKDLVDLKKDTVIYKMHGSVGVSRGFCNSFVISEEDYTNFLARMAPNDSGVVPELFSKSFYEKNFFFLGYGLQDWNLRVLLRRISGAFDVQQVDPEKLLPGLSPIPKDRKHKAIQRWVTEPEKKIWKSRNVDIYDYDLLDFANEVNR